MIRPEDAEFHHHEKSPYDWCETNFFPLSIPEARISGGFYVLTRPKLGVCMSDVSLQDRITQSWEQQLYVDNQQHLPCPASLLDYALPNGLSIKAMVPLKHYRIDYLGIDDTELHIDFKSLMDPFDMNDPAQDPKAAARSGKGWDHAFGGHYEITGHITGEARIRGKTYAVDTVDTLDRSWGPRKERDNANVVWLHGSFGAELTIHALVQVDPARTSDFGGLISGYVLDQGKVSGLVDIEGTTETLGIYPMSSRVKVTDVAGRQYEFTTATINASPWAPYPSLLFLQSFMRWNIGGRIGYGTRQDVLSRAYLTRNRDVLARL